MRDFLRVNGINTRERNEDTTSGFFDKNNFETETR